MWEVCAACDGLGWQGFCFGGKGQLHFVDESAKVDSAYYVGRLLPSLVDNCTRLLPSGYIFQQDSTPAYTARVTQNWLRTNCLDFTAEDQWPPNSPDLNPLYYHVWGGAMLDAYHKWHRNQKRSPNCGKSCRWSGIAYLRDQQTKLSRSSQSDWRLMLLLRVDILNIHSNCNVKQTLFLSLKWFYFVSAWVNVSSGTGSPGLSWTNSIEP